MIDRVVTTYRGFAISQDERGFYWMYGQYRPTLEEAKAQVDRYLTHDPLDPRDFAGYSRAK